MGYHKEEHRQIVITDYSNRRLSILLAILLLLANSFPLYSEEAAAELSEPVSKPQPAIASPIVSTPQDSLSTFADSLQAVTAQQDSLVYAADSIAFHYDTEQIYLYGNTNIKYDTSVITADSLQLDLKKERAFSSGRTIMQDGDQVLIGKQVFYDVNSQTGMMYDGSSKVDKGFYYGSEFRRISGDIYDVDGGRFTTCDDPNPDFWFQAAKMRMYRSDKVVGKPVTFYVNHFPIFYFPFMTFSIKRGRQQGILVPEPGYNNTDGKYVRNIAYFFPYKDYADATASLDLMERTGWMLNLETRYLQRYSYNGNFNMSYHNRISDNTTNQDYAVVGTHSQELPEKASLRANINYVSNKRIWKSSEDIDQSLAQRITSSIAYSKPVLSSYLNVGATYTQDFSDSTVSLSLPSASYSLPTRPVYEIFTRNSDQPAQTAWWTNFNYSYNVQLDHTGKIVKNTPSLNELIWDNAYDSTGVKLQNEHHAGIQHRTSLNYNYKLGGWLNLNQSVNYNETWMDRDTLGVKWVRANDYSAGSSANFTLYGLRQIPGFYVSAVRHIVTPSVGFNFNPGFPDNDHYYNIGGMSVNSSAKSRTLALSLAQKWQLKLAPKGEIKERKIDSFLSWNTSTGIDLEKDKNKVANLSHNLSMRPNPLEIGKTKISYETGYSFSQNPYSLHPLDWKLRNQSVRQSLTISGNAGYTDYFPRQHNDSFSAYLPKADSLTADPDAQPLETGSESWSVGISQDIGAETNIIHPLRNNLQMHASLKLTTNWSVNYSNAYNVIQSKLLSQSFDISRSLHCWKLDISYSRRNEYWDYSIKFYNVQLPDALKFQTKDSKKY